MTPAKAMKGLGMLAVALGCAACSHSGQTVEYVPYACANPSPSSSERMSFEAEVLALRKDALHIDFDRFGADFFSVEVRFTQPAQWKGESARIYYRGEPTLRGEELVVGKRIEFKAKPPTCLDQPWLFLSEIQ